jgi:hypothetical protein
MFFAVMQIKTIFLYIPVLKMVSSMFDVDGVQRNRIKCQAGECSAGLQSTFVCADLFGP